MRSIKEMDKRLDEREQEIEKLQQENKQPKEELEKKNKMYWQQQCAYYSYILYSLEEWCKSIQLTVLTSDNKPVYQRQDVLDKIQELKEKYK